jgi:hypothetical protein
MSVTKKELLELIRKQCGEILFSEANSTFHHGCARSKISEIAAMASNFGYMEMDRAKMLAAFDRYESLKQEKKRIEAWERVIDALYAISTSTSFGDV